MTTFKVQDDHQPASNTAAVVTLAARSNAAIKLNDIHAGYDSDPTGGMLTIESPSGTIIDKFPITNKGAAPFTARGLQGAVGQAVIITLAAGGGGVTGYLMANGRYSR